MTVLDTPLAATPSTVRNPLRWIVFAVVFAANIMDLLDATIVNIAGPSIHDDLGGGDQHACSGSAPATRWPSPCC